MPFAIDFLSGRLTYPAPMFEGLLFLKPLHFNRDGTCTDWDVREGKPKDFMKKAIAFVLPVMLGLSFALGVPSSALTGEANSSRAGFWPGGSEGAVSLTFDDSMPSQLDNALPILDRVGFKATFYLTPEYALDWNKNIERWRQVAVEGHELGNHTDRHPCSCQNNFRHGSDYCLEKLDMREIDRAMDDADRSLVALTSLPTSARSFAYPCYNTDIGAGIGRKSYVPEVAKRFAAARAGGTEDNDPATVDLHYVFSFAVEGDSAEPAIQYIERALHRGRWAVIVFHGIGAEWNSLKLEEFNRFIEYLAKNRHRIWVAPFMDIAKYIRSHRDGEQAAEARRNASRHAGAD
jgi:peptidoglycan/xylan/chitin deacetylase (PgdA/CDA1 family)